MKQTRAGFTLVELLIVIALIAILGAIILAALGGGRQTASDTKIKTYINDVQEAAALYSQNYGDYGTTFASNLCPTSADPSIFYSNSDIRSFIATLNAANGNKTKCATGTLGSSNATSFAIASPVSNTTKYWCVDNTGNAKLSDNGNIFTQIFAYIVQTYIAQTVYAVPQPPPPSGPNLGGGTGTAALCP